MFFEYVSKMKLLILTRHLLIRHAFRDKCIFTDYDYNKANLFSLSSNLKLSIDILMSVRHVFAEFRFIFRKRIMFVFFIL